jgi:ABC-type multidrug transport system ATPase subunit
LGTNGSGKTTFIKVLLGQISPSNLSDDSELKIKHPSAESYISIKNNIHLFRQHLRYCPQKDILLDDLSVHESILLTMKLLGLEENED